jgi:hypothetical protein
MKAKVIPVIAGATGTISTSLRQYQNNILGNSEIKELQKNSHIGHCGKCYCNSTKHISGQNNVTCSTNCKYRTAATLYSLETWFVSGT